MSEINENIGITEAEQLAIQKIREELPSIDLFELKRYCSRIGIRGYSKCNKSQILELLKGNEIKILKQTSYVDDLRDKYNQKSKKQERSEKIKEGNKIILEWFKKLKKGDIVDSYWLYNETSWMELGDGDPHPRRVAGREKLKVEEIKDWDIVVIRKPRTPGPFQKFTLKIDRKKGRIVTWQLYLETKEYVGLSIPEPLKKQIGLEERDYNERFYTIY